MKKILLFLLTFLACTYSAQAEDWLYLMGIDGWTNDASASYLFKYNNGTYTLLVEDGSKLSKKQFKLGNSEYGGKWFGYNGATVNLGNTQDAYPDNGNMTFGTISGPVILTAYHYSWSDSEKKVSFALSEADELYLRGDWNSYGTTQKFKRSGYVYTLTGVDASTIKGKGWQIASGEWKTKFGGSVNGVGTFDLTYGTNTAFASDFPDGTYDLTFDFSTLKLTVAAHSETPTYPTSLYLYPGGKEIPAVAGKEGVYSVAGLTKSEIASFRFNTKSDNSGTAYGTTTGADVAITLGDNIDMKEGGGNLWTLTPEFDGTYNIEINLSTMKFFVTQSKVTYPDVIYYYNGSKPCTVTLSSTGEGSYSADIKVAAGELFRFYTAPKATDNLTSYGAETADQALTLGSDITIVNNTTNKWSIAEAGTYTFTVSLKHHSLNVVKKSVTPTKPDFYLVGEETKDGETAWSFIDDFKFDTTDGVTYTLENVSVTAGKQFKISDKTRYFGYGKKDGQLEILPGNSYNIFIKDGDNDTKNLAWYSTIACNVNITFTLNQSDSNIGNIKVEYVYPELYLRGGFNPSGWDNLDYKMTLTDGVYTYGPIALSKCEFKIGSNETGAGNPWTWGFGSSSTEDGGELAVDADGVDFTIYNVNDGKNLKIGEVSGDVNITFIPDFTNNRGTLRITRNYTPGTGITVYVVAPKDATATPYIYRNNEVAAWPGEVMSKEVGLYYKDGRDVYTYTVNAESLTWIINGGCDGEGKNWEYRYPGDWKPAITVTKSTVIVFDSNDSIEDLKDYDPALFTNVSGIDDVEISNEAPVEFYNLQGVRVDGELTPGLYIRRQGNSTSKVLIR